MTVVRLLATTSYSGLQLWETGATTFLDIRCIQDFVRSGGPRVPRAPVLLIPLADLSTSPIPSIVDLFGRAQVTFFFNLFNYVVWKFLKHAYFLESPKMNIKLILCPVLYFLLGLWDKKERENKGVRYNSVSLIHIQNEKGIFSISRDIQKFNKFQLIHIRIGPAHWYYALNISFLLFFKIQIRNLIWEKISFLLSHTYNINLGFMLFVTWVICLKYLIMPFYFQQDDCLNGLSLVNWSHVRSQDLK